MSFESNPSSKSSPSSTSSTSTSSTSPTSCPFDALFSGVVSVHSMLPELHNLKLEEEEDGGVENSIAGDPVPAELTQNRGKNRENLAAADDTCPLHRIVILGSAEVGKSSVIHQLSTIANSAKYGGCPSPSANEESALCKVQLDHWTAQLEFLDPYPSSMWLGLVHGDQQAANKLKELAASLLLVVYAVDDQPRSDPLQSRNPNFWSSPGWMRSKPT